MAGVTEFVIMSGPEVHDYLVTVRQQLRSYLAAAFPEYRFSLVSQDCEGMGFIVVPVVGRIGGGWGAEAMAEPDHVVMGSIKRALEAFQPVITTMH